MFKMNQVYELEFLDHELDNNLELKEALEYKPINVKLIGKVIKEFIGLRPKEALKEEISKEIDLS